MNLLCELVNFILSSFNMFLVMIGTYQVFNFSTNYILYKNNNYKIALNLDKINTVKIPSVKTECTINDIKCLVKAMEINFGKENLACLYNNLSDLKLIKKDQKHSIVGGSYNHSSNTIKINNDITLPHEFFHMCGAYSDDDNAQVGFSVKQDKFKFGYGLNEGYTELLARRYFKSKPNKVYDSQVKVASLIESLFSNPREMEELYLNHDLKGLIKKLCEYMSEEEAISLINNIDMTHILVIQGCILSNFVISNIEASILQYNKNSNIKTSGLTKLYLKAKNNK